MGRKKKEDAPVIKKKAKDNPKPEKKEEIKLEDFKPDQQNFILEYIKTRNATKSYMMAYPKTSYGVASVNAHKLLKNANVSAYIKNYFDQLWANRKDEIGKTLDNLLKIANADLGSILEKTADGLKVKDFDKIDTSIIQSISQSRSDTKYGEASSLSIRLFDKSKAISDLTKVLGMITEKVEHSGDIKIIAAERPDKKKEESEED